MAKKITTYQKLKKSYQSYLGYCELLTTELKDKVEFDFFILHQQGDGLVMVHDGTYQNGILKKVLEIIEEKGILTYDDYEGTCI